MSQETYVLVITLLLIYCEILNKLYSPLCFQSPYTEDENIIHWGFKILLETSKDAQYYDELLMSIYV